MRPPSVMRPQVTLTGKYLSLPGYSPASLLHEASMLSVLLPEWPVLSHTSESTPPVSLSVDDIERMLADDGDSKVGGANSANSLICYIVFISLIILCYSFYSHSF